VLAQTDLGTVPALLLSSRASLDQLLHQLNHRQPLIHRLHSIRLSDNRRLLPRFFPAGNTLPQKLRAKENNSVSDEGTLHIVIRESTRGIVILHGRDSSGTCSDNSLNVASAGWTVIARGGVRDNIDTIANT